MKTLLKIITLCSVVTVLAASVLCIPTSAATTTSPIGDLNANGTVDTRDVLLLYKFANGSAIPTAAEQIEADLNGDNIVNLRDVLLLFQVTSGEEEALLSATPREALEVVRLVNAERVANGLNPLPYYYEGQQMANIRAEECSRLFSHTRPDGRICFSVQEDLDVPIEKYFCGENIALGHRSATEVFNGWMNSEGHRDNMLNKRYTGIAIGLTTVRSDVGIDLNCWSMLLFW